MTKKTLNKTEYKYWTKFRSSIKDTINKAELNKISQIHSRIFNHKFYVPCTCNPKTIQKWITDINEIYS